jgi:TRAP-type mannitol/chloroaromatic compound transport system permease small subunit
MVAIIRLIERISGIVGFIGAWVMLPLILSMVYEVVARKFFDAPTFWAYEVGYMLAGTCYMFGMGYCLKQGGYLVLMLPGAVWVTIGLYDYAVEAYVSGEVSGESSWNPIIWPFRFVWFVGYTSLTLQAVSELLKNYMILRGIDIEQYGFVALKESTG